jgi:hypothetical protein
MRRGLPLVVCVVVAATLAAVALAQQIGHAPRAQAAAVSTSGSFGISNSRDGQPIFAAGGIAPGGSARGTVAIEDTGTGPVALTLNRGELVDTPGLGGGVLSERLQLTVVDVTAPLVPEAVYSGPLASMPAQAAGELEPGEARNFEFTATLPAGGAPSFQNAVQGAATTVAYSWVADEAGAGGGEVKDGGEPTDDGPKGGGEGQNAGGQSQSSGGEQSGDGAPADNAILDLKVPKIRRGLRGNRLVVWTNCDMTCRLYVRGRLRATTTDTDGTRHRRGARIRFTKKGAYAPGPQRVRIPIPRHLRRWLRESPGHERLRAKLHFVAVGIDGERDAVRKTVRLRAPRR